ncbi:MAG: nodulation protein NfeD [Lentisphaerae bacterium]|jgi:membrane-bound serine protease (ClpP class)|nr:nodulation protein NfeD [Lentisphaerota bacterium]MBT4817735.1 nodulation protein NfeD [Lentisphaerota bacterium]MBT5609301.1 nodulation protein NfeD [Lentisphaerota bacterium]MBT7059405.1 nodulation protein NfeD [Lentisphaerota bacterium]MBT7847789.1 nodulation protein NfeD [Lentisphaerota bacterium]
MVKRSFPTILCALSIAVLAAGLLPRSAVAEPASDATGKVFVLPIQGPIDKSMLFIFRRAFRLAKKTQPEAIIIDLDTPGGRLKETQEIIDWIRSVDVPVYAFVNPNAISAGAIISLASDAIFMSPGSSIGSAMPIMLSRTGGGVEQLPDDVKEKMLSVVRAMVRGLAQENGYSEDLAEAMVDPDKEYKIGERVLCAEGELLNLTAMEAIEVIPPQEAPILSRALVKDMSALLAHVDLADAEIVRFEEQQAEKLARWITMIAPILLALGALGIYIEFKTPGFGLPGIAGLTLLAIFFFGHFVAGLAGKEDMALVIVGLILLGVEIFVIPGFGVVGLLGLVCIVGGLVLGMVPHMPQGNPLPGVDPKQITYVAESLVIALAQTVGAGLILVLLAWVLDRYLPKMSIYRGLILETSLTSEKGYTSSGDSGFDRFLSQVGVAATPLRPAGIVMVGDERVDVVSSGDLIPRNTRVKIIKVEGSRIVVEPAPPEEGTSESSQ